MKNKFLLSSFLFSLIFFSGCGIVQISEEELQKKSAPEISEKNSSEKKSQNTVLDEKLDLKPEEKLKNTENTEIQEYRKKFPEISAFHDVSTHQIQKIEKKLNPSEERESIKMNQENCGLESEMSCLQEMHARTNTTQVTALFFGDMMFDRYIRETLDTKGWEYILNDEMKWFMNGSDITLVNFESAITADKPYKAHDLMLSFTSDSKWISKMKEYGINLLTLGNNHAMNRGEEGFKKTLYSLNAGGIESFGNPDNNPIINNLSVIKNIHGMRIAFISYHELFRPNPAPILKEIKKMKEEEKVDFIVIFPHWGEEYKPYIQRRLQIKAHQFINAGADLIIGHHPHVVAAKEEYKGKYIYYSLGNFVFDQVRSDSVRRRLSVGVTFECVPEKGVRCAQKKIIPHLFPLIANTDYQVRLMNTEEEQKFLKYFDKISPD